MQKTKQAYIGVFGRRNNGKSSLINKLANQDIAIVSDIAGTTTDPVKKSFEITGFGPVVLIDTAGIDDVGELGKKRIAKSFKIIKEVDLAILVITNSEFAEFELDLISRFKKFDLDFIIVHNKEDEQNLNFDKIKAPNIDKDKIIRFSKNHNVNELINKIKSSIPESSLSSRTLLGDIISHGDIVLLITPIDIEAPEGRMILPQVQAIRDILDNDAVCIVLKEREIDSFLRKTGIRPNLVVTDSQVFMKAAASIPKEIPLTSFSIMLARFKGNFDEYIKGTPHISKLKDGDKVLLLESCTHHSSCDDIGRVKIPRWISNFTGKKLIFEFVAGLDEIPEAIENYSMLIQCGGCMVTKKQLNNRLKPAIEAGIPISNYGMTIAYVQGIFSRSVAAFTKNDDNEFEYL
ncbi:MAG: [FeFe] hydrogenase H-cluster maturation GTPase HydF [Marinifilaceae bacterium]|jgi:[FeFe] hydrogenase H-cluster maturation GTPase HydF|nr:[FeFe] hydrogenase H-cluster maturation GTPase HydF [Marinifilaceae bacterium]